jgi:hypothetical protein
MLEHRLAMLVVAYAELSKQSKLPDHYELISPYIRANSR